MSIKFGTASDNHCYVKSWFYFRRFHVPARLDESSNLFFTTGTNVKKSCLQSKKLAVPRLIFDCINSKVSPHIGPELLKSHLLPLIFLSILILFLVQTALLPPNPL